MNKLPMSDYKSLLLSLRRIVTEIQKKNQKQNQEQKRMINKLPIHKSR